jgi:hypothetical protein
MARLERAGVIRPPKRHPSEGPSRLAETPPGPANGAGVLEALLEERRQGR